ncbi:adenylyltransferase and sulfurtransferase [Alteribacillus persepolensis]|uniref:Adenylyltransferase and sulfurtransferase n=1 Tax=Alteribacillus persepolensis TaxID=568899 RepID=A0A1G8JKQ3_9BACI|nr:ThiF family adenylyltransferase [Alteribacillus persepolensis]SDI31798.1 adenylyltransferase and sulfurtransferase [Alteribacillus persepolensis]
MKDRYARQQLFSGIGKKGQENIRKKNVLIIGAGALGGANAEMLVRAGVGKVTIVDRDYVDGSNLHRQQLFTEQDAIEHVPKAIAAEHRLEALNTDTEITGITMDAKADNLESLVKNVDLVVDGSDNYEIRFIINDLSQKYNIPWVMGACAGSHGMSYTFIPGETPCLQCVLPSMPDVGMSCETSGIISPAVQVTASMQTTETLKLLSGNASALRKKLLLFDVWQAQQFKMNMDQAKKEDCLSCGLKRDYPSLHYSFETKLEVLCGRDTVQIRPSHRKEYDFSSLEHQLEKHGTVRRNPYVLTCLLHNYRLAVFQDGRVLVHGTNEIDKAKTIYHQYLS